MVHINIVGIYYDLNRTKGQSFLYRGLNDFKKDFKTTNNSNQVTYILTKYMNSTLYKNEQKKND